MLFVTLLNFAFAQKEPLYSLTPEQQALIDTAVDRERGILSQLQQDAPLVQVYLQTTHMDPNGRFVPQSDQYILQRIDSRVVNQSASRGFGFDNPFPYVASTRKYRISRSPTRLLPLLSLKPSRLDRKHYFFQFVRSEFLGEVRTLVFDVHPRSQLAIRGFIGRIWVEDKTDYIVRFNGELTNTGHGGDNVGGFHFDSWRENLQPGRWLPVTVYAEGQRADTAPPSSFRVTLSLWGYATNPLKKESDSDSLSIENVEDRRDNDKDLSPLEAQRQWLAQAETNVLDRLVRAALLAPPSDFDSVCETIVGNILISNNINLPDIHCRVLLTSTLESLSIGNTIIISKGLIDVLPSEADLAAVLSFQVAHIMLGHRIENRMAFNDRLLSLNEPEAKGNYMAHSEADNEAAARQAVEMLKKSPYSGQIPDIGPFFSQLSTSAKALRMLNTPQLGDSLLGPTGKPWLIALLDSAPSLPSNNVPALQLWPSIAGSREMRGMTVCRSNINLPPCCWPRGNPRLLK